AQQLGPLVARILQRRWLARGEDRSTRLVLGDDDLQRGERTEIRQPGLPERETVAGQGFYRSRPDSVHLLLAEPEAVPRVERVRRYDRVVRGTPLVDPALRGEGVQVPYRLRLVDRVPGRVDPDVRAPRAAGPWRTEQVPDHPPRGKGDGAGRAFPLGQ